MRTKSYNILFSIGFLSAAIIAFQLVLMQILSIVQWYHFAYMVISVALLGFGAAGSVLAIFQKWMVKHVDALVPGLMIFSGIAMSLVTGITQLPAIRFDSYLLFSDYDQIGRLLITYLLFFIPFFTAALAIGLVFIHNPARIGTVYFANLLGSGAGGLLALMLIQLFFPSKLPAILSLLPVLSAILLLPGRNRFFYMGAAMIAVAVITWRMVQPSPLVLSQYKDLSKTLLLPEAQIKWERTSPFGLIQIVTSPVLRYAPGLSLTAQKTAHVKMAAFINGDWFGAITGLDEPGTSHVLDHTTLALPFIMSERKRVLVLRSGTGIEVGYAVNRGASRVVAVEPNEVIMSAMKNELAAETDSLYHHAGVSVYHREPRSFLMTDTSKYDLIMLPMIGAFGGGAGLSALQEQFMLTREAVAEMWSKLESGGVITVTSWMDHPFRNPLKILATFVEVLEDAGIKNPRNQIAAIRSWGTITYVLTKSPLPREQIQKIRLFCDGMLFDPAFLPGLNAEERNRYNQFDHKQFFSYTDRIFSPSRESLYGDYAFNIRPSTDNKPYFSQYIKWRELSQLAGLVGNRSLPFYELGYLVVIMTFIQLSLASLVLIVLPLLSIGWKGRNNTSILLYFTGTAIGYMFIELVFIQRLILYFGNPVYSASAVITCLLIFSGLGSRSSSYFLQDKKRLWVVTGSIVLILCGYSFVFTPVLQQTIHYGLPGKMLIVLLLITPLAFLMGIPFPAGLSYFSAKNDRDTPWAWGLNGCASVISTALATMVAVEMGFAWVMLMAALAYCLPLFVQLRWS
ncbi:MAG: hypothetical protein WKF97_04600 [Chitinophagaceae bacterium]